MSSLRNRSTSPPASIVRYKAALRRAIRRNRKDPEIDFLNITAMLDLMTILLVFMLQSISNSSDSIPQSKDLRLPSSIVREDASRPTPEGVVVTIAKSQILVGNDPTPVVLLPSREQLAQSGVDSRYKRSGPNDLYIVPLAQKLAAAREADIALRGARKQDTSTSEAIVVADEDTPYRLLVEVLFTLGQSQFGKFHMMVVKRQTPAPG
jgi:biopolymer transport protein ExbD